MDSWWLEKTGVCFGFEAVVVLEVWESSHFGAVECWSLDIELEDLIVEVVDLLRVYVGAVRWEFAWLFVKIDLQMRKLLLYLLRFFIFKKQIVCFIETFLLLPANFIYYFSVILALWGIRLLYFIYSFDAGILFALEDWGYLQRIFFLWLSMWI